MLTMTNISTVVVAAGGSPAFAPTMAGGVGGAGSSVPPPLAALEDSSPIAIIVNVDVPGLRSLESEPLTLDVENVLAAAYGNNSGPPSPGESMQNINISTYESTHRVINESGDTLSQEKFPLVLGCVLLIALLVLTAFAAVVVFQTRKKDRRGESNRQPGQRHGRMSWVGDQSLGMDLITNAALMSWKDLSCRYPSRKSGCADVMTLSGTTGEIRCKELVAIMVSDICDMLQPVSLNMS